jgi:hypothetical protein
MPAPAGGMTNMPPATGKDVVARGSLPVRGTGGHRSCRMVVRRPSASSGEPRPTMTANQTPPVSAGQVTQPTEADIPSSPTATLGLGTHATGSAMDRMRETEFNRGGAPTFRVPGSGAAGQRVPFDTVVYVTCKVKNTVIPSASTDGYWCHLSN